ncbi:CKLF-like MARVEL transmembrane domain-containing protein 6, partial [Carlito syrichta]|uniref:CKLF-like MARVEL transmembrane domain-containing protein 6 n=1 Tax=Carlito syrichta TaxID=1868482 RepID=A0A1U7TD21_CARSF
MENGAVYSPTTEEDPDPARGPRGGLAAYFFLGRLPLHRRVLKGSQLLLSLLAFVCEEVVSQCTLCGGLYFFEFVSCSAFLLSLLILIVYCTPVYERVDAAKVRSS